MNEITGEVIKRGETCVIFTIHRNQLHSKEGVGMFLSVKTHPAVEDFMRSLSTYPGGNDPITIDVGVVGRHWVPIGGNPLIAYNFVEKLRDLDEMDSEDGRAYTLNHIGQPLLVSDPDARRPLINLSFLRLRGVSEGSGVTFGIHGVNSLDQLRSTRDQLSSAVRKFYTRYLKPVDLSVICSTQELSI